MGKTENQARWRENQPKKNPEAHAKTQASQRASKQKHREKKKKEAIAVANKIQTYESLAGKVKVRDTTNSICFSKISPFHVVYIFSVFFVKFNFLCQYCVFL